MKKEKDLLYNGAWVSSVIVGHHQMLIFDDDDDDKKRKFKQTGQETERRSSFSGIATGNLLLITDAFVLVAEIRIENVEQQDGNDDGRALEPVKEAFVLCELAVPAFAQLGDTEDAAGEDENSGEHEGDDEAAEGKGATELVVLRVERVGAPVELDVAVGAEGEVAGKRDEDEHDNDLEGETSNHDVGAQLEEVWIVEGRACGHATAGSLKSECYDVAGDEDPWVQLGSDARVALAKGEDDAPDAEVDAGCVKGWSD